jgi:hypothetical protein
MVLAEKFVGLTRQMHRCHFTEPAAVLPSEPHRRRGTFVPSEVREPVMSQTLRDHGVITVRHPKAASIEYPVTGGGVETCRLGIV